MLGGNKENSSGAAFSLGGAAPGPSAPSASKGGAAPGGFSFGALGGGDASTGGLPLAPSDAPKGSFSFGGGSDAGGGASASASVDPPPSAPRSGLPGGFSLAGGPKIDLPKPDAAAPAKPLESTKSGGFAFGGAAKPAAAAAEPAKPVLSLAKPSLPSVASTPAAKSVGFSLQPLGGSSGSSALAKPGGPSGTSALALVGDLPDAPDLVGPNEPGSGSNRALLNGLRGPDFATLLSEPATQKRLEMLTQMYSGPAVVAQDKETLVRPCCLRLAAFQQSLCAIFC